MASLFNQNKSEKLFLRYGHEVVTHMKHLISHNLVNEMHSVAVTRGYCYLGSRIYLHIVSNAKCFGFECRLSRLFRRTFVERSSQRFLFHVNIHNWDKMDGYEVLGRALAFSM